MNGALPPSSSDTFLTVLGALRHQLLADFGRAGEGELAHQRVARSVSPPIARGVAGHDAEHAGRDAGALGQLGAARAPRYGVCVAGLSTIVQPAASAGPALRVIIAAGKFHGVIAAATPIGCLITTMRLSARMAGNDVAVDALAFLGEPLDERGGVGDLALATSASGLPCSAVIR